MNFNEQTSLENSIFFLPNFYNLKVYSKKSNVCCIFHQLRVAIASNIQNPLKRVLNNGTYKFRLMLVNGWRGVIDAGAHKALLAKFLLLFFVHCNDFFTVHNVFGMEWHFRWLQLPCNLWRDGVLMLSRLTICTEQTEEPTNTKSHLHINALF